MLQTLLAFNAALLRKNLIITITVHNNYLTFKPKNKSRQPEEYLLQSLRDFCKCTICSVPVVILVFLCTFLFVLKFDNLEGLVISYFT